VFENDDASPRLDALTDENVAGQHPFEHESLYIGHGQMADTMQKIIS
jgi:hypothetical protein